MACRTRRDFRFTAVRGYPAITRDHHAASPLPSPSALRGALAVAPPPSRLRRHTRSRHRQGRARSCRRHRVAFAAIARRARRRRDGDRGDEIARSGAHGLATLLRGSPASRSSRTAGRAPRPACSSEARTAQTVVLIDGLRVESASAGATRAGGDPARTGRADRDPARSGVDALRRRCDRRRHPGLHAAGRRRLAANASAGYGTYAPSADRGNSPDRAPVRDALSESADAAATATTRSSIRRTSRTTPTATATHQPARTARRGRCRTTRPAQYFRSRLDNRFDGGDAYPTTRSPRSRRGASRAATV